MGAERRAHHARENAMRAAAQESARMETYMRQQQESMMKMAEALKPAPTPAPPSTVKSSIGDTGVGVRTARSRRQTTMDMSKGLASLRIPLNIGGETGGGLNIG